jgi:hypothetical protein
MVFDSSLATRAALDLLNEGAVDRRPSAGLRAMSARSTSPAPAGLAAPAGSRSAEDRDGRVGDDVLSAVSQSVTAKVDFIESTMCSSTQRSTSMVPRASLT